MSVQFVLGRSGSGKSSYCINSIVDALCQTDSAQPLILLVPEQATYQAERAILADKRISGYSRLKVLSFDRLQFLLLGKNTAKPVLSNIGQQMIITRILRENKSTMKVFADSVSWGGLTRQMTQTISELNRYAQSQEDIDQLLQQLQKDESNKLTAMKFADIGLVFKEYLKFIEDRFIDPDVQLNLARRAVGQSDFIKDANLWVDGFAGFTTGELAVLTEMLKVAEDTKIALCLDPEKIDIKNPAAVSLFGPIERTYEQLVDTVKEYKIKIAKPVLLKQAHRFSTGDGLAHIERNIFELAAKKIAATENVRIVSAANVRTEVEFVANRILKLVREKGFRYRDIAVIASDIDSYQHYIKAYFDDYSIPFFIDKRKSLNQHVVIHLLSSALSVISGGFAGSDIFAYLKTGLTSLDDNDIALIENYCLAFGLQGKDWTEARKWTFQDKDNAYFDEQRVNKIRLDVIAPLLQLKEKLCANTGIERKICAEEFTKIIFDFLDNLNIFETIAGWIEEAEKQNQIAVVEEHQQFCSRMIDIFDELVDVFDGFEASCNDFIAIVNSAFSQMTMAFIPPTLDQVLVGSIERSRHPDLKAVFLVGVTQKLFPAPISNKGLLSDSDRQAAEDFDFCLGSTISRDLAERRYLAYIAFTRAANFLCISYPSTDSGGAALVRSQFIGDVESLFRDLTEEPVSNEKTDIANLQNQSQLAQLLCSQLGKGMATFSSEQKAQMRGLLDNIRDDDQLATVGENVLSAINYNNTALLEEDVVAELFGNQIKSSATRLGMYAACPYKYFARYILNLKERQEFKLKPLDIGNFYHRILDGLLKDLLADKKNFDNISDDELLAVLRRRMSTLLQKDSFISNFVNHRIHNSFIINSGCEILEEFVLAMAKVIRAGEFRPVSSEISFGNTSDELGEYKLLFDNGKELLLRGKIDRFDIAKIDEQKVGIVFDYKRREKSFSWAKFYHGLDLQLAIYMLATVNAKTQFELDRIAGAFYMPVEVSTGDITVDKLEISLDKFLHKAKGIFDGEFHKSLDGKSDSGWSRFYNFQSSAKNAQYGNYAISGALKEQDFQDTLRFAKEKIVDLAKKIVSGNIKVSPYKLGTDSGCGYCEYKSVCRFDWEINGYNNLGSIKDKNVFFEVIRANDS